MSKEYKIIHGIWTLTLVLISCGQNEKRRDSKQSADNEQVTSGQEIFLQHCQSCHKMSRIDESMFSKVFDRLPKPSESYFTKFVRDSKGLKTSGDEYSQKLDLDYTSDYEHSFSELTEDQIQKMIHYIKSKSR